MIMVRSACVDLSRPTKTLLWALSDAVMVVAVIAVVGPPATAVTSLIPVIVVLAMERTGIYRLVTRFITAVDATRLALALVPALALWWVVSAAVIPLSALIAAWAVVAVLLSGSRLIAAKLINGTTAASPS